MFEALAELGSFSQFSREFVGFVLDLCQSVLAICQFPIKVIDFKDEFILGLKPLPFLLTKLSLKFLKLLS